MVKKNFAGLTQEEFIERKSTPDKKTVLSQICNNDKTTRMIRQTIYIPEALNKKLWHHRVDTGKSISLIIIEMAQKYLKDATT